MGVHSVFGVQDVLGCSGSADGCPANGVNALGKGEEVGTGSLARYLVMCSVSRDRYTHYMTSSLGVLWKSLI